ncbi:MAG: iron-sulfur cluster assembly scaffold protein [Pirellulales bacterium]|nr:iron-sulfur cluster assembly scaffold protein [Pirellulales bacterium]
MAWEYSEKTKKLFMDAVHGKPGTHLGEIENPDGVGEHGSIACGDAMQFMFRVEKNEEDPTKDQIVEAKYLTFGCTSAIAASEALCMLIEQDRITPIDSLKITNDRIVEFLDGLPEQKIHCSVMGAEALESAVFDWARRRGVDLTELGIDIHADEQEEGRLVCKCFSLSEPYIRRKIKELGLRNIPEITAAIKAGGACMSCHHAPGGLQDLLDEVWEGAEPPAPKASTGAGAMLNILPEPSEAALLSDNPVKNPHAPATKHAAGANSTAALSPYQFSKKVEQVVDKYVRPMLHKDGGDLEIIDIKDRLIYCQFQGRCEGCAASQQTLKVVVERTLKDLVDQEISVIQV